MNAFVIVIVVVVLMLLARLRMVLRVLRLPLKNGEDFFLSQKVGPDFYRSAGLVLLRQYHASVFAVAVMDAPLIGWFLNTKRPAPLVLEQALSLVVLIVIYNFMVVFFSGRATALFDDQERPATSVQLSMASRRLRDYTVPSVEAVIALTTLISLGLLAKSYVSAHSAGASYLAMRGFRGGVLLTAWVLYWQVGFLLAKGVSVRWRMPLPANRTEDFRRWRTAWLDHNVKVIDSVRAFSAVAMLAMMTWLTYGRWWPRTDQIVVLTAGALAMLLYFGYVRRQERKLAATERELKPVEMVKEFPRRPIAEGRYLAGGLLYVNRDNPSVMVRSMGGVALNVAHRAIHIGAAYFVGLIALVVWMTKLVG